MARFRTSMYSDNKTKEFIIAILELANIIAWQISMDQKFLKLAIILVIT